MLKVLLALLQLRELARLWDGLEHLVDFVGSTFGIQIDYALLDIDIADDGQ